MNKRYAALAAAILAGAAFLAGIGAYLKYDVIRPLNLPEYSEKSVFELPFLYFTDEVLQFMLTNSQQLQQPPASTVPSTKPSTSPTTQPSTQPTTEPTTQPTTQPTPPPSLPEGWPFPGAPVEDSWFDDVLFIGNSRTQGLKLYARSGNADYFADQSMSVFNIYNKTLSDRGFPEMTLEQLLATKQYGKIYINFGINEAGYSLSMFRTAYEKFYNMVRTAQPDAVIVLQGVMAVTRKYTSRGDYFQPAHLAQMNEIIASLADGEKTVYASINDYVTDEEGYLLTKLTNDGCHLTVSACKYWRDWLAYIGGTLGV